MRNILKCADTQQLSISLYGLRITAQHQIFLELFAPQVEHLATVFAAKHSNQLIILQDFLDIVLSFHPVTRSILPIGSPNCFRHSL